MKNLLHRFSSQRKPFLHPSVWWIIHCDYCILVCHTNVIVAVAELYTVCTQQCGVLMSIWWCVCIFSRHHSPPFLKWITSSHALCIGRVVLQIRKEERWPNNVLHWTTRTIEHTAQVYQAILFVTYYIIMDTHMFLFEHGPPMLTVSFLSLSKGIRIISWLLLQK